VVRDVLAAWKDDSDEPFSTRGIEIPWNLRAIQADAAWREERATGRGIVVAVQDTGLMIAPALTQALWKNPGEVLNGQDDDGDGYVDDLFGYDFNAGSYYCLGDDAERTHGSACAGIIAGRPNNRARLVTGVAPRARLMILRGMGYLKGYEYALDHGADVISLSFMWINHDLGQFRGVYRTAHEHLAAAGVVAVGGAGNFSDRPRGKQIAVPKDIPCVIAAAGLTRDGLKAPLSREGPCTWAGVKFYDDYPPRRPLAKPDVTAFFTGYPVWWRPPAEGGRATLYAQENQQMALVVGPRGNSFSGPHAAGVAALMLSVNPDLCAWEVKELMEKTCRDLGLKGRDYTYGAGLLQANHAVRAARRAAR
jgi:subtilisin family serine protease